MMVSKSALPMRFAQELDLLIMVIYTQLCRRTLDVVEGDIRLQYKIELALAGMVDGPPGGLPLAERLARLRDHRARAGTFALADSGAAYLSKPAQLPMHDPAGLVLPAFGGSIATVVVRPTHGLVEVFTAHGPASWDPGERELRRWEMSMEDLSVPRPDVLNTLSVDVVQDLLVVVQLVGDAWSVFLE